MLLYVVLHLHSPRELGQFDTPMNDLVPGLRYFPYNTDKYVERSCNETHQIRYTYYAANQTQLSHLTGTEIHVYRYYAGFNEPPIVQDKSHTNLLFTLEPPLHLPFSSVPYGSGYSGMVSYRTSDSIKRTIIPATLPMLQAETQKNDIGIWVDNCLASPYRNRIIQRLLKSTLQVKSMGNCMENGHNPQKFRVSDIHGQKVCQQHRIMLAVENHACVDWISPNFEHALRCGAIPLVYSLNNSVPFYPPHFPVINAAEKGWFQLVEKIMHNDTFYRKFLHRKITLARLTRHPESIKNSWALTRSHKTLNLFWKRKEDKNYECKWFDMVKNRTELHWPMCDRDSSVQTISKF